MASARNISCDAQNIKKSIINRVPPEGHKSAKNVTVLKTMRKIIKSNGNSESFSEPSIVKLGEGGYNDVFQYIRIHSMFLFCGSQRKASAFSLTKY